MNKLEKFVKSNPKTIIILSCITVGMLLMLLMGWDIRAVAIIAIVIGYITKIFAGLAALVSLIPVVGPLIVKVLSIPFFWLLNAFGYFTSAYAIKKGYGKDVVMHRTITIALLTGIVIGYILGHLAPFNK